METKRICIEDTVFEVGPLTPAQLANLVMAGATEAGAIEQGLKIVSMGLKNADPSSPWTPMHLKSEMDYESLTKLFKAVADLTKSVSSDEAGRLLFDRIVWGRRHRSN